MRGLIFSSLTAALSLGIAIGIAAAAAIGASSGQPPAARCGTAGENPRECVREGAQQASGRSWMAGAAAVMGLSLGLSAAAALGNQQASETGWIAGSEPGWGSLVATRCPRGERGRRDCFPETAPRG